MGKLRAPHLYAGRLIRVAPSESLPPSFRERYMRETREGEAATGETVLSSLEHLRKEIQSLREELSRLRPDATQRPTSARDVVTREELDLLFADAGGMDSEQPELTEDFSSIAPEENPFLAAGYREEHEGDRFSSQGDDEEFEEIAPEDNPFLQAGYLGEQDDAAWRSSSEKKRRTEESQAWWESVQYGGPNDCQSLEGDEGESPWSK